MNKKVLIVIVAVLVLIVGGALVWAAVNNTEEQPSQERQSESSPQDLEERKESVLEDARNYQPAGACTSVMTPARHVETGATYTFPSGCIPDGWEKLPPNSAAPSR